MRGGSIHCTCGKPFYYETQKSTVKCVYCGKEHEAQELPVTGETIEQIYKNPYLDGNDL